MLALTVPSYKQPSSLVNSLSLNSCEMKLLLVNKEHPEYEYILEHLPEYAKLMASNLEAKGLRGACPEAIVKTLTAVIHEDHALKFYTAGPLLVGMSIGIPWWGSQPCACEAFILRYKEGNFYKALASIETAAKESGAVQLVIGTLASLREDAYSMCLIRKGYQQVSREFIKEL